MIFQAYRHHQIDIYPPVFSYRSFHLQKHSAVTYREIPQRAHRSRNFVCTFKNQNSFSNNYQLTDTARLQMHFKIMAYSQSVHFMIICLSKCNADYCLHREADGKNRLYPVIIHLGKCVPVEKNSIFRGK